jgi:hypothetical protein
MYITTNMENKYWFSEESSNASANSIIVDVFNRYDDEHIGTIKLNYSYDKNNNYEEWTIESTEWHQDLTLQECDEAMQELLDNATDNFHEFAFECYNYDPREDDDEWWCV